MLRRTYQKFCFWALSIVLLSLPIGLGAHTEEAIFIGDQIPDPELPWWEAHDWFASSVAIDGDTAVVGAAHEGGAFSGSVYVYVRDAFGNWYEQAKIPNPTGVFNFGKSVSIHNDTILITALDGGDYQGTGYAYIYARTGSDWNLQASLFGDSNDLDGFGYAGSIFGSTAVVTAWHDDDQGKNAGAAHVFKRSGTTWTRQAKLYASDADAADHFGRAVDIEGNTLAVNSMLDFNPAGVYAGNAYIFVRQNGVWVEQAKLEASDGEGADNLGVSLNINRNYLIAGALGDNESGALDRGSAYVFRREKCTWVEHAKLEPSESNDYMYFGMDVAIQGNTAIVGAQNDDDLGEYTGSVFVFNRDGNSWYEHSKILASDAEPNSLFGLSLDMSDDKAVVGASLLLQGKAYMYDLSTDNQGWGAQSKVCFDGCHP